MATAERLLPSVHHFARAGLHAHLKHACNEGLAGGGSSPVLLLWRAYGLAMEGASAEVRRCTAALRCAARSPARSPTPTPTPTPTRPRPPAHAHATHRRR
jgi:hypothetical protein